MRSEARNQVRREQTELELSYLLEAINEWLGRRRGRDRDENNRYVGRHKIQLEAIESVLTEALQGLKVHLQALNLNSEVEEFYDRFLSELVHAKDRP